MEIFNVKNENANRRKNEQSNINVIKNKFGWAKPLIIKKYPEFKSIKSLPTKVDLREIYILPEVFDQGELGSCTANALAYGHNILQIKQKYKNKFSPSRLFIYYQERKYEGTINEDSGAYLSTGIYTLKKDGVCKEKLWPYIINKYKVKPSSKCFKDAKKYTLTSSSGINVNLNEIKNALANKYPVVFGFLVFDSFLSDIVTTTGIVPIPNLQTENILGGHAVCLVGYNDETNMFIAVNSWGKNWGDNGFFYIPYEYVTNSNLCDEFYALKKIRNKFTNNTINKIKNIKKIILRK
jgi:C1A family cysteine protease